MFVRLSYLQKYNLKEFDMNEGFVQGESVNMTIYYMAHKGKEPPGNKSCVDWWAKNMIKRQHWCTNIYQGK